MKTKTLSSIAALLLLFFLTSCQETNSNEDKDNTDKVPIVETNGVEEGGVQGVIPADKLRSFLPEELRDHKPNKEGWITSEEEKAVEVNASFFNRYEGLLNISIADLGNFPSLYKNYLSGGGLYQSTWGQNYGLQTTGDFRIANPEQAGASLHQSTNYGVIDIAQSTGEMLFNTEFGSFIIFDKDEIAFEAGSKMEPGLHQETIEKVGGIEGLAAYMESSASGLERSKGEDGSYFMPYKAEDGADVAGWVMFDKGAGVGMMLLGVAGRIGVLIEGNELDDLEALQMVAKKMDFRGLEKLAS